MDTIERGSHVLSVSDYDGNINKDISDATRANAGANEIDIHSLNPSMMMSGAQEQTIVTDAM